MKQILKAVPVPLCMCVRARAYTSYTAAPPSIKIDSIFSVNGGDEIASTAAVREVRTKSAPGKASFGCLDNTTLKRPGRGCLFAGNACHVLRPIITAFCFSMLQHNNKQLTH